MSFLQDAFLPSRYQHAKDDARLNKKSRSSSSSGGIFSPLVHLVKDPAAAVESFVNTALHRPDHDHVKSDPATSERRQILYLRMQNADNFDDWRAAAAELDEIEGNNTWKNERESLEYNYELVEARCKQLDEARINCDVQRMLFLIRTTLTRGLGGMGDLRLYKHSHVGTKTLIDRYIDSAKATLTSLLDVTEKQGDSSLDPRHVLEQLLATRQSFGRSALLLSGGGTFGMNHIGVVKSLWENHMLPRIVSGASAGSIVCAVLCTKADSEMERILEEFCYGELDVFEKEGEGGVLTKVARFLKYGALFDIGHLTRVIRNLLGDLTFQESYNRTRRILNITVSSASAFEVPRLLNYITAPNVLIWSAVAASCSVPLVFSAASLQAKDPATNEIVPWDPSPQRWIDGSVDNDLPITRLAEMFNVNHFIVSQVNPHVVPFLEKEEGANPAETLSATSAFASGPNWLHSLANLAKGEAQYRLHALAEMGFMPNYCTKARSILSQRYSGDITIFPAISYSQFPKILSNPSPEFMQQALICGERATWPKLSRVQNHCAIELALDNAVQALRARVVFSPSQVDLRINVMGRPSSSHSESGRGRRPRPRGRHQTTRSGGLDQAGRLSEELRGRRSLQQVRPSRRLPIPNFHAPRSSDPALLQVPANEAISSATEDDLVSSDSDDDCASLSSIDSPPSMDRPMSHSQLFPSVSQPSTPNIGLSSFRSQSSTHLAMTKTVSVTTQPSEPERVYKRLFHRSSKSSLSGTKAEEQQPQQSPQSNKNRPNVGKRRESASGLQIDISGTRGMLLRRKRSLQKLLPNGFRKKTGNLGELPPETEVGQ
ncbi:acyl transferase/acyl hydrolase/lysophospholipase [Phyllosticta citribraziliensis]|uniref:Patatin-like phospholipase domain-containing protein n=1 Tax=Phyllosticta citribraziliensis TaxID=989973 RepID=A0ABR1M9D7_9PEZI